MKNIWFNLYHWKSGKKTMFVNLTLKNILTHMPFITSLVLLYLEAHTYKTCSIVVSKPTMPHVPALQYYDIRIICLSGNLSYGSISH